MMGVDNPWDGWCQNNAKITNTRSPLAPTLPQVNRTRRNTTPAYPARNCTWGSTCGPAHQHQTVGRMSPQSKMCRMLSGCRWKRQTCGKNEMTRRKPRYWQEHQGPNRNRLGIRPIEGRCEERCESGPHARALCRNRRQEKWDDSCEEEKGRHAWKWRRRCCVSKRTEPHPMRKRGWRKWGARCHQEKLGLKRESKASRQDPQRNQHKGSVRDGARTQRKAHQTVPRLPRTQNGQHGTEQRWPQKKSSSKESGEEAPTEAKWFLQWSSASCCVTIELPSGDHLTCSDWSPREFAGPRKVRQIMEAADRGWEWEREVVRDCHCDQKERCAERTVRWNARRSAQNRVWKWGEGLRWRSHHAPFLATHAEKQWWVHRRGWRRRDEKRWRGEYHGNTDSNSSKSSSDVLMEGTYGTRLRRLSWALPNVDPRAPSPRTACGRRPVRVRSTSGHNGQTPGGMHQVRENPNESCHHGENLGRRMQGGRCDSPTQHDAQRHAHQRFGRTARDPLRSWPRGRPCTTGHRSEARTHLWWKCPPQLNMETACLTTRGTAMKGREHLAGPGAEVTMGTEQGGRPTSQRWQTSRCAVSCPANQMGRCDTQEMVGTHDRATTWG